MEGASSWLNGLVAKVSYGVQGNNSVGSYYAYQALYDTAYPNATNPGAVINDIANEDLTWESNHNLNAGIEARFIDRIDLSVEYYNRTTTDMLLAYPLPLQPVSEATTAIPDPCATAVWSSLSPDTYSSQET